CPRSLAGTSIDSVRPSLCPQSELRVRRRATNELHSFTFGRNRTMSAHEDVRLIDRQWLEVGTEPVRGSALRRDPWLEHRGTRAALLCGRLRVEALPRAAILTFDEPERSR